jgi:Helix-turn-helix domain
VPQSVDRYRWQQAVCGEHGPKSPTGRLVLMVISLHMDAAGKNAWPSQATVAKRARVSRRTVVTHVKAAERDGWICRCIAGRTRQGWRLSAYEAQVPDAVYSTLREKPWETDPNWKGGERVSPLKGHQCEPAAPVQAERPERGANSAPGVVQPTTEGGATDAKPGESGAHKSFLPNPPYKSSLLGKGALARTGTFERFCDKGKPETDEEAKRKRSAIIADLLNKGFGSAEIPRFMHTSGVTLEEVQRVEASGARKR